MKVWAKRVEKRTSTRRVALAALEGVSREELLREALAALETEGNAQRIGVWLEEEPNPSAPPASSDRLHGLVRDRENQETTTEFTYLSLEPPLPLEPLLRGKSAEQNFEAVPDKPMMEMLVGLRRAAWIPVYSRGSLKGLIFFGSKGKQLVFSRERTEAIAAELALAVSLEEEQRIARARQEDLSLARSFLGMPVGAIPVERTLANLAESCTDAAKDGHGPGAAFAVIGVLSGQHRDPSESVRIEFRWRSGDEAWARAIETEPLATVWRRALKERHMIGSEPQAAGAEPRIARIVAFPLEAEGQLLGTLVAGLPAGAASLAGLERLELRAMLAACALYKRRQEEEQAQSMRWQQALQSKLLQTEKLASLGQMVSGIAHELSNPLTSILGYAQRLLVRQGAPGRSPEVQQIFQEAERAGAILRQLLLHARETSPERRLVSLNQIVQQAMELQRFSLAAEKIRVEVDLDPDLPPVHGDPGQLQQVLMNLVRNAQQALELQGRGLAAQAGGIIRVRTKETAKRRILLEVEDNGPGIPPANLERIFDPFFTTKPAGVGTGLGLAIVLSIIREHGGQVHVISPPRGGAVFQIELPAEAREAQESAIDSAPAREREYGGTQTVPIAGRDVRFAAPYGTAKGVRVLVVEDEPTVARLIADVLEDEGMQVDVLPDGREALDHASRQSYDLVICDMKMPGLDGQHFYKSLERSGSPLRERFLFVTGDVIGAQTREFLERNRVPHVAKPFRVEELTEKVRGVLEVHSHREPPAAKVGRKDAARNG